MFFMAGKTNNVSLTHEENRKIQSVFRFSGCFHVELRVICFKKKHFSRIYIHFLRNYKVCRGKMLTYVQNLLCQISSNLYSVETNYFYSIICQWQICKMYNLFFFKICHARYLVFNLCHSRGFVHHGNDKKSKLFHTNVHKTLTNVWEKTIMPDIQ